MTDDSRFFSFLKERIGLDVTSVGEAITERACASGRRRQSARTAMPTGTCW